MNDLRYSFRSLSRMRGAAVVAIATLALGIATTTTMFSVAYAALLRPLPFADPDRLVLLFTTRTTPQEGVVTSRWSKPLIDSLVASVTSYESLASFTTTLVGLGDASGNPEQIDGEIVSPEYFPILNVTAVRGRTFSATEDTAPGGASVVLLSDRLWHSRYGADAAIVGRTIRINDVSLTVAGVMPPGFRGLSDKAQIWIPRTLAPRLTYAEYLTTPQTFIAVIGRLKRGVTLERANAELQAASAGFQFPDGPAGSRWSALARTAGDMRVEPSQRRSVRLLVAAATCVLAITCANVSGLLLARGRMRRQELAIRMALGAGRGRIVRYLMADSLVLAAIAGTSGTALAFWGIEIFTRYAPAVLWTGRTTIAPFSTPSLDGRALLFALGVTFVTSLLCGLAPLANNSPERVTRALNENNRSATGPRRLFRALVVSEVAIAALLLAESGVLLEGFARLQQLRQGYDSAGVLTFWVRPPTSKYRVSEGPAVVERLLTAVQQVPGVESAAVNRCTPFTGCSRTIVFFPGRPNDTATAPVVGRHYVSADYFKTLGIPVLAGRALTPDDRAGRPPVAVISESAARRFWPGGNPLGQHVWFGGTTGPFSDRAHAVEIVGIVGDVKYEGVDLPDATGRPEFYTSYLQFAFPDTMVIAKTRGAAAVLVPLMRRAIASVDPALPIYDVMTLDDRVSGAMARPQFNTTLITGFAAASLLIAALGVYVMVSYSVSSRLREIGVRLALGAAPRGILRFVVGEGLRLGVLGVAIGVPAAFAAGRLTRSFVDADTADPWILAAVGTLMLAATSLAAYLPARRASALDPVVVLRHE